MNVRTGRVIIGQFPAGGPRGSWPAEEFAQARRLEGEAAEVVMDLSADAFLVVVRAPEAVVITPEEVVRAPEAMVRAPELVE